MYDFAVIRAATVALRTPKPAAPAEGVSPNEKRMQDIANLCATRFGCHAQQTRELVELIMEVKLPEANRTSDGEDTGTDTRPPLGVLIRFGRSTVLTVFREDDGDVHFVTPDGGCSSKEAGDYVSRNETWTPATDRQIDAFIAKHERARAQA